MTNRNKLLFSDRCFWRHVAFSVLWLAQGGVVRNPTLTDLDTSRNPLIPPHQAPQQSPSRSHWSSENWATPSGMTMQRRGHAMVSFLVASRIELKSLGRIWMFAASPGWTWKNTICAWGEELPGEHGDRAGGAPCWDGVWVTLSSARFPGLEEGKKNPNPHQSYGQPDLITLLWLKCTYTETRICFGGWHICALVKICGVCTVNPICNHARTGLFWFLLKSKNSKLLEAGPWGQSDPCCLQ